MRRNNSGSIVWFGIPWWPPTWPWHWGYVNTGAVLPSVATSQGGGAGGGVGGAGRGGGGGWSALLSGKLPLIVLGLFVLLFVNYLVVHRASDCMEAKHWPLPLIIAQTTTEPSFRISMPPHAYGREEGTEFLSGAYDPDVKRILTSLLPGHDPATVIEIGSNAAFWGLYAATLGHKVIEFEANSENLARIKQSLFFNKFSRFSLRNMALADWSGRAELFWPSDKPDEASFHYCNATAKMHSGVSYPCGDNIHKELIRVDKLDFQLFEDVLFMSIDVVGHEAYVLGGATSFFSYHTVDYLYIRFYAPTLTLQQQQQLEQVAAGDNTIQQQTQQQRPSYGQAFDILNQFGYYPCSLGTGSQTDEAGGETASSETGPHKVRLGTLSDGLAQLHKRFEQQQTSAAKKESVGVLFCHD